MWTARAIRARRDPCLGRAGRRRVDLGPHRYPPPVGAARRCSSVGVIPTTPAPAAPPDKKRTSKLLMNAGASDTRATTG